MRKTCILIIILSGLQNAMAQQNHQHVPQHDMKEDTAAKKINNMSHAFSLNLPMNRNGSGTGWLPDSSVMYGHGAHVKNWMFMFHNNIFIRYNRQDIANKGTRGGKKFDVPNWFMLMGQRKVGQNGLLRFNTMISFDPFTVGGEGYPLLFQSGETYNGKRLVDRQHPHDLFSELSIAYTHAISKNIDITGYLGYPGEPALGPVAFMHRLSSLNNPDAPLGHHWQDATHITFGVATLGFRFGKFKIEGSSFTGREPNEKRYDFDRPRFDSYSYRLLFNPNTNFAFQVSRAYLVSPETAEPGMDVKRTTASVIYHQPLGRQNHYISGAAVWGFNRSDHDEHSILLEPTWQMDKTALYGRYEWIQKSGDELEITQFNNGQQALFNIQAFTMGINRVLLRKAGFNTAIGLQGSLFIGDARLDSIYGKYPMSGEIYLRLYPHLMHIHDLSKRKHSNH